MGFKIKSKFGKAVKRVFLGGGLSTKQRRSLRRRLGLTSKNKPWRTVKRFLSPSTQPTSATDLSYFPQYQSRRISEMM